MTEGIHPMWEEFMNRSTNFLPPETVERAVLGNLNDLTHYLGNMKPDIPADQLDEYHILCAQVKAAQPGYEGADDVRREILQEQEEKAAIRRKISEIGIWINLNSQMLATDPEMAAKLREMDELRDLLDDS